MDDQKPVIVLVTGNDFDDGTKGFLKGILKEIDAIVETFEKFGALEIINRGFDDVSSLLDILEEYENRIAILHFAGHSNSNIWQLDGGTVYADKLAKFLEHQHSIQLLFLNGCSNEAQVSTFAKAGVPALIATSQPIKDGKALQFALHFYKSLTNQQGSTSLKEAFQKAHEKVEAVIGETYRVLNNDFRTLDIDKPKQDWAWGLHPQKGDAINWKLTDAIEDCLFGIAPLPQNINFPQDPFVGLRPFTRNEARVFFGRSCDISKLIRRVQSKLTPKIILFHGQSGVGKSSMLRAGVLPRLEQDYNTYYRRRDEFSSLKDMLIHCLRPYGNSFKEAWLTHEKKSLEEGLVKPLFIVFDQLEVIYTNYSSDTNLGDKELREFVDILTSIFEGNEQPQGKILLSLRKEWLPDLQNILKEAKLTYDDSLFLKPLDKRGIEEVVTGATKLKDKNGVTRYSLIFAEEGKENHDENLKNLPTTVAHTLLDKDSPTAPILQILLTEMYKRAKAKNAYKPRFNNALYESAKEGYLGLDSFLERRLKELSFKHKDMVESGFALDLLVFHIKDNDESAQRTRQEIYEYYSHHNKKVIDTLIANAQALNLLSEVVSDSTEVNKGNITRLAHDTLATPLRRRFERSNLPGQQARRILENRLGAWTEWEKRVNI